MKLSMFSCSHFLSFFLAEHRVEERPEERKTGEELVVAKSEPVSLNIKNFEREKNSHVAGDAISAHTQVKMAHAYTTTKAQMAKIMVQYGRSGCSS